MTALLAFWLATFSLGAQPAAPLTLDVRVFRGPTEVTGDTVVTAYRAGNRTNGRPVAPGAGIERQIALPPGQYDLQLVQQQDGKVIGISWTTLRLLVDYPGEYQRHLEVLNFEKGWGALQIRKAGQREQGTVPWTARLLRADGSEAARGVPGDGYQVLVAPAGTYTVEIRRADGTRSTLTDVEVKDNLTYVRTF